MITAGVLVVGAVGAGAVVGGTALVGAGAAAGTWYKHKQKQKKLKKLDKKLQKQDAKRAQYKDMELDLLLVECEKTDKNSQFAQFEYGMKVQSPEESEKWLRMACAKGHCRAAYEIGLRYADGTFPQSDDVAMEYFQCALERGVPDAYLELGKILIKKGDYKGAKNMYKQFIHTFPEAPNIEEAKSLLETAKVYTGDGTKQYHFGIAKEDMGNSEEAVFWLQKAVDQQNPEAAFRLASYYKEGKGVEKNEDTQIMLLLQAGRAQHTGAAKELVHIYAEKGMMDESHQWQTLAARPPSKLEVKSSYVNLLEASK